LRPDFRLARKDITKFPNFSKLTELREGNGESLPQKLGQFGSIGKFGPGSQRFFGKKAFSSADGSPTVKGPRRLVRRGLFRADTQVANGGRL
jgi:hypothetical protein